MTWQYIAGFFDGEGSISVVKRTRLAAKYQISIAQVNFQAGVLQVIGDFLQNNGVRVHYQKDMHAKNPMIRLRISDSRSVLAFINGVEPFIHVKLEKCVAAKRDLLIVVERLKNRQHRVQQAMEMRRNGSSYWDIQKATDVRKDKLISCGLN